MSIMTMKNLFLSIGLFLTAFILSGQTIQKKTSAIKAVEPIRIDGVLDETMWQKAPVAGDFVQREPYNGKTPKFRSEVRFLYDNSGLYVGATMYDPYPDSIPVQLGLRDSEDLNADYLILMVSPFNDGINAFCFTVWASDVQSDFKLSGTNDDVDYGWDAVWLSKARRNTEGWVVEMKIPYSAIRFPKKPVQEWGLNCERQIRRFRELDTWNFIDAKVSGEVNQCGILEGIREIKPPLRLSLTPYVSGYLQNSPEDKNYSFSYNYGADLKYGLNESFTLDMTLIPDFGQVRSDDKIYNFSPFEIRYDERRQFFTEGTELFSKGGIFYSRRVGSQPKGYNLPEEQKSVNEIVTENPGTTKLINASKISGRTNGGLGIGVFNAISANTWATLSDTITGESRRVLTQGFTNYNVFVLDQNLKNNSFIDFLNTNYFMPTEGYTANVTGTSFKFANKKYTYAFSGEGFVSQKYYSHDSPDFGFRYLLSYSKISGNFLFDYQQELETDKYDPNDMGFNMINNIFSNSGSVQYNIYDPFWKLLNWYNWGNISYNCLYNGLKYTSFEIAASSNATTIKHLSLGINTTIQPIPGNDYYEPRVNGWMYVSPAYINMNSWISSDYSKIFSIDASFSGYVSPKFKSSGYGFSITPRYRVSDRMFMLYEFSYEKILNDVGYVNDFKDSLGNTRIIFGRRDRQTVSNVIEANYMITSTMSIDLRARHYWVTAPYYSFYSLQCDGNLMSETYSDDPDVNFNLFNIDLTYIWNFAPGSQISLMWKNAINTFDNDVAANFFDDFGRTIASPASNSFSIRLLYYLDALYLKGKRN